MCGSLFAGCEEVCEGGKDRDCCGGNFREEGRFGWLLLLQVVLFGEKIVGVYHGDEYRGGGNLEEDGVGEGGDEGGAGKGEGPGVGELFGLVPMDGCVVFSDADAGDGACNHMGGTDWHTEEGGEEDDDGCGSFCCEALVRMEVGDGEGHCVDDAKAARGCAKRHNEGAGEDHPEWDDGRGEVAACEEAECDDPHAFLRVVNAVGKGNECGRGYLKMAENFVVGGG